jgi:hypothetical protein
MKVLACVDLIFLPAAQREEHEFGDSYITLVQIVFQSALN